MTLDDARCRYSRADAVSVMLLKRLQDAVRDGDPILAVISSAATNHSGESFSITHPHGPTQKRLYQSGMLASKTLPEDFSYIECTARERRAETLRSDGSRSNLRRG